MLVVGLTGGIASGKSTVSAMFASEGVPVICADQLAHEAVRPGSPAIQEIVNEFGSEVLDGDRGLDRIAMAKLVFNNPAKRKLLESIIHPKVSAEKTRRLDEYETQGYPVVIVDVPLLFEAKWQSQFDLVILVYVPRPIQEERLATRDRMTLEEIRGRLDAQIPIEKKKLMADIIVDNRASVEETRSQVRAVLEELFRLAREKEQGTNIRQLMKEHKSKYHCPNPPWLKMASE